MDPVVQTNGGHVDTRPIDMQVEVEAFPVLFVVAQVHDPPVGGSAVGVTLCRGHGVRTGYEHSAIRGVGDKGTEVLASNLEGSKSDESEPALEHSILDCDDHVPVLPRNRGGRIQR